MPTGLDIANVSADDDLKVGALADGLATSAVNSTDVDDGSNGAVGVANAIGSNNDSSTNTSTSTSDSGNSEDNGNNRDNHYEWESKVNTTNNTTNTTNTSVDDHTRNETEVKDSFNTKDSGNSFAYSDSSTTTKDNGNSYDFASTKDSYNSSVKDSGNSFDLTSVKDSNNSSIKDSYNSDSSSHYDYSLGNLKDVQNSGQIGIAGGDLNFHIGDDYAFNLNLDSVLNNSLNGDGMHTGFSLVQANNLSDQDTASNMQMNNQGATNNIYPDSGHASSDPGASFDGGGSSWDHHVAAASSPTVHDATSYADASSIVSNSGFHQELVQGANMVSNATDIGIVGGNDHHDTTTNS